MLRHLQWMYRKLWGVALLWLLTFALCLSGWALLSGSQDNRQTQRVALAGEIASAELAGYLWRTEAPQLGPQVRALLVRDDVGFAWLRVRDTQGHAVASAGRLEAGMMASLPGGLRRRIYDLVSTEHRVTLWHDDIESGALEFGLLLAGGGTAGTGGRILAGMLLLTLGLPALLRLSLRLRMAFLEDWSAGGAAAARAATVAALEPAGRTAPASLPPAPRLPPGARELLEVFDRGVIIVDRHQAVMELNPLASELIGWTAEQTRGRPLSEVLPLYRADLQRPVSLSLEDCFSGACERVQDCYYLRSRDGALREVNLDAGPLRDATGFVTGVLLSVSQTSPGGVLQKIVPSQAPASPQESRQLSQMLLDQVLDCVVTTDSQDRIQFANGRALEAFGYRLTELRGEHISRLLPVPFLRRTQLRVADLVLTLPEMPDARATVQRRDGSSLVATLVVHPVSFRGRQGHVVTVRPLQVRAMAATGAGLGPRLRHFLASLPDEAYAVDADSLRLLAANPAAGANLGFPAGQLEGMTLLRLCPRLSPDTLRNDIARLREGDVDIVEFRSWHQRANGSSYAVSSRLSLWSGEGAPVLLLTAKPVEEAAARPDAALREDRIDFLATHDVLTGLPNQALFMQRLQQAVATPADKPRPFVLAQLALIDLDETCQEQGDEAGDRLIKAVADRLSVAVRSSDTVARAGADGFVLLMGGIHDRTEAAGLLKRLQQALSPPWPFGRRQAGISACLGAAVFPDDAQTPEKLLRQAGLALDEARARGPGHAQLYRSASEAESRAMAEPAGQLREAQLRGELGLELQPLHDVRARCIIGAEVLMAWQHPDHGLLRTAEQLRQAGGDAALAGALGFWILEQACEQQANWRNLELHALPLLINLSALPLADRRAAQALRGVLARHRVPPEQLIVMVNATELETLLLNADSWLPILRDLGLRVGVNDADAARMDLLRHADIDVVRLTPRTLAGLPESRDAADQTQAIIQAAQRLGARIFASGVERAGQREALLALGCHIQQGRLLGGPQDPRLFARTLVRSDSGVF